ncbi:ankyrin repeat domain-containing protein [Wolbachia endosymbiont (group E) of Neria commutata]|uniref:ankyrin repeat domain-containing protein n=1 Tax=Wolbachia endosymbiont (group E) of Neria commutata TaxID=3066149 RepID=UPI0031331D16
MEYNKIIAVNKRKKAAVERGNFVRVIMSKLDKRIQELLANSFHGINEQDESGETVLHLAARFSDYERVKLLIEKGADVNAKNNEGKTPLHSAALSGKVGSVSAMIEAGSNRSPAKQREASC